MTSEMYIVFGILLVSIILFSLDRFRLDLIALVALLSLLLTGILTPGEALAGFADPVVIMIAGLFVVGAAIFESGIANLTGSWLGNLAGTNPLRLTALIMLVTALLSAFLSSTGTVAVMLPVVVHLAHRANLSPSKLLIPLAFSSLLGGMLTLIGTPPNLIVSNLLRSQGLEPFSFFAFTPVGLVMLMVGLVFMLSLGQKLLPQQQLSPAEKDHRLSQRDFIESYSLKGQLFELQLSEHSACIGQTLAHLGLRSHFSLNVLSIETLTSRGLQLRQAEPNSLLQAGDTLIIKGKQENLERFSLEQHALFKPVDSLPESLLLAEVLLPPRSSLLGKNLRDVHFKSRFRVLVLAEKRAGEISHERTSTTPLRVGDTLLVAGSYKALNRLKAQNQDFIVVSESGALAEKPLSHRAPWVLLIMLAMLGLMTFAVVANVTAVLLAAVAVILLGAMSMDHAYQSINWESIVLIAAILPMATALEKTGALDLLVNALLYSLANVSPYLVLLFLFLLTSALSQVISNTATTVLIAPVALQLALNLGLSPYPLLMTVAIAASTAFMTPVASPVNTLVINPGHYRFADFLKIGFALQLFIMLATLLTVALIFPF